MMPAQLVLRAVAMLTNPLSQLRYLCHQFFGSHLFKIFIHNRKLTRTSLLLSSIYLVFLRRFLFNLDNIGDDPYE